MRSHSCFKHTVNRSVEVEKPNHKEEPHLSGAYIRSLVKQLSSSRSRASTDPSSAKEEVVGGVFQDLGSHGEHLHGAQQQQQLPRSRPPKKQVRRRLHTTRPYQERLFNMAEARREIVAALRLHRAAIKQANEHQQQQQNSAPVSNFNLSAPPSKETSNELMGSVRNTTNHLPNYNFTNYLHGAPFSPITFPSSFSWACPSITPLSISDNLNFPLPDQPLGLNLNLQSFKDIDISLRHNHRNQQPIESSQASSSSCSYSPPSAMLGIELPAVSNNSKQASQVRLDPASMPLHLAMDDEEMAEIHSIGEQHDMEWNDKVNLATTAWWSKFLKSMEGGLEEREGGVGADRLHVFDEFLDIPSWLNDGVEGNTKETSSCQQDLDDNFQVEDYLQDTSLASLDIGEIGYW
ncbi:unnamed protein product [Musa acuminata var. zebrina]